MLDRHIRRAGIRLIEAALSKKTAAGIFNPLAQRQPSTSASLLAALRPDTPETATATTPKLLTLPT